MKLFTLIVALCISSVTNATTYYISPTGNDNTGNGTIGNPWRTLYRATSTVTNPGDIIHVNAGTYTETQGCHLSRGVSIEGEGRTSTIINSTLTGTWSTFLDLQSPDGTNNPQHISGLTLDGGYVNATNVRTWVGIWITGRSNVEIHDCALRNWKQSSTIFNGNGNTTNPGTDVGQSFATGNKFYNNIVTNSAAMYNGTGQGALMIGFQIGMEIYGNNIQQIERPNFQNGWPIKYWNQGWLKGVKIYNNTLTKIPYSGSYPGENGNWDFAIEFFNIEGLEIYGNTIQGAIDMAYNYRGAYPYCAWIHDNNITHPVQGTRIEGGIIFEYRTESAIVENNTINNKTYGITFNTRGYAENGDDRYYLPGGPPVGGYSYIQNCIIRKNLFSNIYEGTGMGNRFAIGVISDGPEDPQISNMQIYNNTLTADPSDPGYVGMDFTSQQFGNCNGLYVRNNIVTGFTMGWLRGSNNATNIANCTVTHNNAFGNSTNAPFWPGGNPTSYTYNNNLAVNPLFISILSFLLQPLSPCINSGVNVGLPYNGAAPDMGYSEFGGPLQGPPTPPVVGAITQPTCTVSTGSVALSGLPLLAWTLTRSPGGNTTLGVGPTATITGLPSGTYTYTVTDLTGTSAPSANIVINTQPATPSAPTVGTITQPTCALATGSVVLNGLPASGTWTLIRTPGAVTTTGTGTTRTITGLAAGTYTYTVTNAGGCISGSSANIVINAQPTAPTAPTVGTITQPSCAVATGTVVLNGLPATGTWTLTVTPGGTTTTGTGTTTTVTGLNPGTYTYTVTNAAGCISPASANVVINATATPPAPTVGTITQPTCAVATGTVVLNNLPATGTWTLTRTPGAVTTTGTGTTTTITGLATGTYTYTVTNAAGCTSAASGNVVINAQPASPAAPIVGTITQPTCTVATGSVVLSGLPAAGTWTLTRTPGAVNITGTGTTTTIAGLNPGTYTYTVTNAGGCTSAASANVVINPAASAPAAPTVGTITQPTCAVATGSVVLNGLPASGTWTLTTIPGGATTTGTGTTTTIAGLNPGTYNYTVTNAAGCTSTASANVLITATSTPSAPLIGTVTQPGCTVATGSVVLNGLPATGTWTLTRTPGAVTTTGTGTTTTITGLTTGTYTYTVTNASGCTSAASGNVGINAQPASPTAPIVGTITQPTCAVATGSVALSGLPASGTWTLTRTPGAVNITGTGTTTTIAGLTPGTYTYTVTNAAGCISGTSGNVVITAQASSPAAPTVGAITHPTCAVATGSVVLNGLPATGTWTLTRTPGNITTTGTGTSTTITGLAGGTYTYTVTNAAGCISIGSANIVINAQSGTPAAPTVGTITQPGCTLATGSVTLTGLPATGTWTLTRTPGAVNITGTGTTITITGLATGTYSYTVTNAAGCISASSASIVMNAQPSTPTAPIVGTITQPTCAVATGSVALSGLPASGTWTLTRTPGAVNITGTGTTTAIAGLDPGTYTYTVTNAGGCTSAASGNVVITAQASSPAAPTVGTITQPTCAVATGSVALSGLPATGTWTLIRTPGNISTTGTGTTTTITGLATGTYTYTVTNAAGCISIGSANIVINAQPATPAAPAIGTITQPSCTLATGSVVLTGLPATGTWTLTRTPGGTTSGTGTTTTITGLAAGTYTFTVTSAAGCTSVASGNVVINAQPATPTAPIVGTIIQPNPPSVLTGSVDLSGLPATGTWTLTRTPGAVNITGTGTTTTIAGLAPGVYTYTVTNSQGCTSSPSGNVVINGGPGNIAPDADAGPDQIITLPTNTVIVSGSGTDVDGIIVGYTWTKISGPAASIITNPGTAATSITGLVQGVYEFELSVTDNQGASGRDTMQVVVNGHINIPPNAFAGGDQTIVAASMTAPTSTTIAGMGFDPDGTVVAYNWTKISGPSAGSVTNPNNASSAVSGLAIGVYQFELSVTDNDGAIGRDTMQITIIAPPNFLPIANAGSDQNVVLPANSATLSGSGNDVDGTIVSYSWVQVSGPSSNVLLSPNTAVAYVNNLVQGTYEFRLTVTDNRGGTATDNMLVIVTGAPAPPVNQIRVNSAGIFPNPVVDIANLKITSAESNAKLQIRIADMNGKTVMTKEPTTNQFGLTEQINMNSLIKGMYIITVKFPDGEMATIKAVKM